MGNAAARLCSPPPPPRTALSPDPVASQILKGETQKWFVEKYEGILMA